MLRLRLLLVHLRLSWALSKLSPKLARLQKALLRHLDIHKKQQAELSEAEKRIPRLSAHAAQIRELSEKAQALGIDCRPITDEFLKRSEETIALISFGSRLTNLNLFIILCLQDLLLLLTAIRGRSKTQTSNFAARMVALHCYETTDTLLRLLGSHRLSKTGNEFLNPNTNTGIKKAVDEIKLLRRKNTDQWELLRNNCVAHRDEDAFKQLAITENLDALSLLTAGFLLAGVLARLIHCLTIESHNRAKRWSEIPAESAALQRRIEELKKAAKITQPTEAKGDT